MYLLVFVTLVIGLIAVYGQILTAQTARMAAAQTGFVQTMRDWHSAAVSMAASVLKGVYTPTTTGCSLTAIPPTGVSLCVNAGACGGGGGVVVDGTGHRSKITIDGITCAEDVHLPSSYQAKYYQFYSVLYAATTGARYVITWIPNPTAGPAPGYILLPTNPAYQTSMTMADVAQQFRNVAGASSYTYGTVKNRKLSVGALKTPTTTLDIDYEVPACVLDGAIATISSADGY